MKNKRTFFIHITLLALFTIINAHSSCHGLSTQHNSEDVCDQSFYGYHFSKSAENWLTDFVREKDPEFDHYFMEGYVFNNQVYLFVEVSSDYTGGKQLYAMDCNGQILYDHVGSDFNQAQGFVSNLLDEPGNVFNQENQIWVYYPNCCY